MATSEAVTLDVTARLDGSANGVIDAGEPAIPGVVANVHTYATNELGPTVTWEGGTASMTGLVPADFLAWVEAVPRGVIAESVTGTPQVCI